MEKLNEAVMFFAGKHTGQFRKGQWQIPYFTHCVEVMKMVSKFSMQEYILIAALGHDYIEDCDMHLTLSQKRDLLEKNFGKKVADIVWECTRLSGDDIAQELKIEFLNSFENKSWESVLIKVCDRYANCADYASEGRKDKCSDYFDEAKVLFERFHREATSAEKAQESLLYNKLFGDLFRGFEA